MIFWVATALAASPGGFRVGPGVPTHMVGAREVVVVHPGEDFAISQTTVRAQYGDAPFGADLELPIVTAWGGGYRDTGLGQVRVAARTWLGARRAPVSMGLELAAPLPRPLQVQVWGSLARDTLAGWEMMLAFEGALWPDHPLTWRVATGWRQGPEFGGTFTPLPLIEGAVAYVQPVAGPVALGGELEALVDLTPVTLRPFVRFDGGDWSVDLAAQLPLVAMLDRVASVQVGAQLRRFF